MGSVWSQASRHYPIDLTRLARSKNCADRRIKAMHHEIRNDIINAERLLVQTRKI
jgi:hypothetical protein